MIEWVRVEERLPTDSEQKIVTYIPYARYKWKDNETGKYCVTMAHYNEDNEEGTGHWFSGGYYVENVVAWTEVTPYIPEEDKYETRNL